MALGIGSHYVVRKVVPLNVWFSLFKYLIISILHKAQFSQKTLNFTIEQKE